MSANAIKINDDIRRKVSALSDKYGINQKRLLEQAIEMLAREVDEHGIAAAFGECDKRPTTPCAPAGVNAAESIGKKCKKGDKRHCDGSKAVNS